MRLALILAVWCIALLALASMNDRATNYGLPLVASALRTDYPICVMVKPGPLLRSPQGHLDYQLGEPFNDKGVS